MASRLKVYELAKDLGMDPQDLVESIRRLGINVKSQMSILGTEEIRLIKEQSAQEATKNAAPTTKGGVVERRVGATVIRRRAKPKSSEPTPEEAAAEEESAEELAAAPLEEAEPAKTSTEATPEPQKRRLVSSKIVKTSKIEVPESPLKTVKPVQKKEVVLAPEPERKRRVVSSLIKRVSTETHLGQTIGPKPEGVVKRKETTKEEEEAPKKGPKRFKEIEVGPATQGEAVRETGKRRLLDRQSTVFKKSDYLKRELVFNRRQRKTINRPALKTQLTTPAAHKRVVTMGESISVGQFAQAMGVKAKQVIEKLMNMGVTASINESIDHDTATLCAHEFQFEVKQDIFREEDYLQSEASKSENLKPRPPVVTVMGHVDHGKTSLLDRIRKANVVASESGGITQHIGAYSVKTKEGKITFVDTPGHEAFTQMRARGAKVTDIVVLVVAATEGAMPQTVESINHAKAAQVPIIVAINKIDLPDANPERVKQTLAGHDLTPEEWGGETIYVNVSAKTGEGIDKLLESILLQAEVLELKADYEGNACGTIIEAKLDKNRGPVATVLVQSGKLNLGANLVCGPHYGKARSMVDSTGASVKVAEPSDAVEILGIGGVPTVGDDLNVVEDERTARELVAQRLGKIKEQSQVERKPLTLEEMLADTSTVKELRVIIKADVQGSAEAIQQLLSKFPSDKVTIKVLHVGTGGITESDVMLASASAAVILGFNIRPDVKAKKAAEKEGIQIHTFSIIYELGDHLKQLLEGMLDKQVKERVIGRAQIRDTFDIPKVGRVAGSAVVDGKVTRNCFLRILRDSRVVYEGKIGSLRRFKEDVKEVASGYECGISVENYNDLKPGDELEAFVKDEIQGTL